MSDQDRYIPGVPCWVDTTQPDPDAAVTFYGDLFGWTFEDVAEEGGPGPYHVARRNGGDVGAVSVAQDPSATPVWNSYIWVDSADETAKAAVAAGGTVLMEPMDMSDAGRMAVIADPEGAALCLWQPAGHRGATVVNEHGSVNFNTLHTRDLEHAKAFYGALFGWEPLDLGGGYMWALPAYADFLEERTPGFLKGMDEMGAPARFGEVVAGLEVLGDDQPGTPAHWSVTFAVDDADAIAARAAELGATVAVAPFDVPWSRMTVITDPQGASFTASQFIPENKDLATPMQSGASA